MMDSLFFEFGGRDVSGVRIVYLCSKWSMVVVRQGRGVTAEKACQAMSQWMGHFGSMPKCTISDCGREFLGSEFCNLAIKNYDSQRSCLIPKIHHLVYKSFACWLMRYVNSGLRIFSWRAMCIHGYSWTPANFPYSERPTICMDLHPHE